MLATVRWLIFGSPLPTSAEAHQRLGKLKALAVFSSDALSSVAYSTEEMLLVLLAAGSAGREVLVPISLAIASLLAIVAVSYRQTIHGYPSGGGAYIVAHDNLGKWPGLIAAAALLTGYVLTVAVSITAGVAAISSALPALGPYRVEMCVLATTLVAWANLRGAKESGTVFSIPTYGFIITLMTLVVVGLYRSISGRLVPLPAGSQGNVVGPTEALGSVLILRAFASGCAALTGVEAISNGIPAFEKPEAKNAGQTLVAMVILLASMFLGISFLAHGLAVTPVEGETVVSQIGRQLFGTGPLYLLLQAMTALILILAANTSFADFPRLSAILARDGYLPRQFKRLGDRLVFSNGIIALAVLSAVLIIIFGGQTHSLIPLYAVGVFLSFTLSQTGMVRHWQRVRGGGWRYKAVVNGVGACATGMVSLVVLGTKFARGAWVVAVVIPLVVLWFDAIRRHYGNVADELSLEGMVPVAWHDADTEERRKVIVPLSGVHRASLAALHFARSLSADVKAVIVDVDPKDTGAVLEKWRTWGRDVPLVVLESPYRSTIGPLLQYLDEQDQRDPDRGLAVVVLPEFVCARWWHHLLHNQWALLVRSALTYRYGRSGEGRVIVGVPYFLGK